jgi:hypothetical protein
MTTGAIVITWGAAVRGREAKALEVFGKALATMEGLAKEGRIHAHKEYVNISGNATTFSGFQLVEGEIEELLKLQVEDGFRRLQEEASNIVENFTVTFAIGGTDQAVQTEMTRYVEVLQGLGYL